MRFKKLSFSLLASLCFITLFVSCSDDDSSNLGLDVLPSDEMIKVKINDSLEVTCDQIIFNEERLPQSEVTYLGIVKDSVFGEINAAIFTQFSTRTKLETISPLNNSSLVSFESMSLHIVPDTAYKGGVNDKVIIDVYPLSKALSAKVKYTYAFQSNDYVDKSSVPLATFELNVSKIKNGFDVQLPKEFADKFFQYNDTSLSKIDELMPGLCFIPRSHTGMGLVASINFKFDYGYYPLSYMNLKYKVKLDSIYVNSVKVKKDTIVSDSIVFTFASFDRKSSSTIASENPYTWPKANPISYAYSKSVAKTTLNGSLNDSCMYISNMGGAKIRYNLSSLSNFPVIKNSIISKAELIIPFEKDYFVRKNVNLAKLKVILVAPDTLQYGDYSNYFYNVNDLSSTADSSTYSYKVDITNYIESYIAKESKVQDIIVTMNSSSILDKAVIKRNKKPTLKIKYTTF